MKNQKFEKFEDEMKQSDNKENNNKLNKDDTTPQLGNSNNIFHFNKYIDNLKDKFTISKIIDDMGFSNYHFLLFAITALILICAGIQEAMISIVLCIINEKSTLSQFQYALFTTSEYAGLMSGSILVNVFTRYLSNKRSIQLFSVLTLIFTGLSIFGLNFYLTITSRFFIGLSLGILDILLYLNLIESCPTKIRGFVGSFILVFFPLGSLIIAVMCYFYITENHYDNYRFLLLVPFCISSLILLILLPFLEDSARRMVAINDLKGSVKIMRRMSKFNRNDSLMQQHENVIENIVKNPSYELGEVEQKDTNLNNNIMNFQLDSKKHPSSKLNVSQLSAAYNSYDKENQFKIIFGEKYIILTLILWTLSLLTGFIFNGVFYLLPTYATKLEKKAYGEVILSVCVELPSNFLASILIENKILGRLRSMKIANFFTLFICCFVLIGSLVSNDLTNHLLTYNFLLKFFITISSNILLIYGSEIYEGKVRTFGTSAMNFWKRLATISSPFIVTYMDYTFSSLGPYYIFLVLSILLFSLSLMLNIETRGVSLEQIEVPQTI